MAELNLPQQNFSGVSGGGELSLYQYFIASPLFAEFKDFNGNDRKLFLSDYSNMPPAVKNFFASTETATTISSVGLNYQLDDNQVSAIAGALRELLIGKIFIQDLPMTVSSKLGIDDVKAGAIVNSIVSKSFAPIMEDLKRIQRSKFPDKIMQLQKGSRPEGLSAKPSAPAGVNNVPLNQPTRINTPQSSQPKPPVQSTPQPQQAPVSSTVRPPAAPSVSVRPPLPPPSQPRPALPPQQPQPVQAPLPPKPAFQPAPSPAPAPAPQRPPVENFRPPAPTPSMAQPAPRPAPTLPPKPQFMIPDLGQPITKDNTSKPMSDAQRSLEAELENVAGIIDLRSSNKPKE